MSKDVMISNAGLSTPVLLTHGDFDFDEVNAAKRYAFTLLWLALGLGLFIGWAAVFEIDQSVRANGQVIPTARTQIIQAAEPGVVASMLVTEGDVVERGQLLAVLEKERPRSAFDEARTKIAALEIASRRAWAELQGTDLSFGNDFNAYPELIAVESALFAQRQSALEEELAIKNDNLALALEELQTQEMLLETGDTSQLEVMRARREVSEIKGQILALQNDARDRAGEELSTIQTELEQQRHRLTEKAYTLGQTELRSPVKGSVKFLSINTLGGVVRTGDELMQITPLESKTLLEVSVCPCDIGSLAVGLPVAVKFDAFDYPIYGDLRGRLEYISTDTFSEEGDGGTTTYYRAHIRILDEQSNTKLRADMLKHGMRASVDIQTGTRTVLEFMAKPVLRAFDGALSQK